MSLCSPHTQMSYRHGPIGWSNFKSYHHYRAVYPTSKSSMHVNMHRKMPRGIKAKSAPNTKKGLINGVRALDKQRPLEKRFVGIKNLKSREINKMSDRLASYDPIRMPAEGKGALPPIENLNLCDRSQRIYTSEEVKRIVTKVGQTHDLNEEDARELVSKLADVELAPHEKKVYAKLSKPEVQKIVDRLANYDPTVWPPNSRGVASRDPDLSGVMAAKKRTVSQEELSKIVGRLATFDPLKWPPGSPNKGFRGAAPEATEKKKFSKDKVTSVVDRLSSYDKMKWPAESLGTKKDLVRDN